MQSVIVTPVDGGWTVRSEAIDNDLVFRSGANAEAAAKRLARALADAGDLAQIEIYLRGGVRAARFVCAPQHEAGPSRTAELQIDGA